MLDALIYKSVAIDLHPTSRTILELEQLKNGKNPSRADDTTGQGKQCHVDVDAALKASAQLV